MKQNFWVRFYVLSVWMKSNKTESNLGEKSKSSFGLSTGYLNICYEIFTFIYNFWELTWHIFSSFDDVSSLWYSWNVSPVYFRSYLDYPSLLGIQKFLLWSVSLFTPSSLINFGICHWLVDIRLDYSQTS